MAIATPECSGQNTTHRCQGGHDEEAGGVGRTVEAGRADFAQTPYVPGVGKPRVPDRVCLTGILFVLKTGIPWEDFPHEMGCCGMTLWNRLDEWRRAGVWNQLHRLVLNQLRADEQIDLSRVIVDSS